MSTMITCFDHHGKKHTLPASKFSFRPSANGIFIQNNAYLMVQERWTNLWELPGGGAHIDESIPDALKREYLEETGLTITVGTLLRFTEDYFYAEDRDEGWHSLRFVYRIESVHGTLKENGNGDDIVAARFMTKDELTDQNTAKPFVFEILKNIV